MVVMASGHFSLVAKVYFFIPRCRHHHRGHHSAESGSDRDSSYSRDERRRNRSEDKFTVHFFILPNMAAETLALV